MFGEELRSWILGLDFLRIVALVRSLLIAEANRLGADLGTVRMTGIVTAADEGVDGRTDLSTATVSLFPLGPQTWQIKKTSSKPSIKTEVAKKGVQKDLLVGRGYVMVWAYDPPSRTTLEKEISATVASVNPKAKGMLLALEDLERLARVHPAVVQALGGPPILGLSIAQWEAQFETESYPFAMDSERESQLAQIQRFAQAASLPTHLHVFGDTGVGKSRLVFEALRVDGLRERAFVSLDYEQVPHSRLAGLVSSEETHGILVVDDTTWDDAKRLETYTSAASGRLRLITIGDRPSRDTIADLTSLDVNPLGEGVIARLVESASGLGEEQAQLVAELTEGFPKLAVELALTPTHIVDR